MLDIIDMIAGTIIILAGVLTFAGMANIGTVVVILGSLIEALKIVFKGGV